MLPTPTGMIRPRLSPRVNAEGAPAPQGPGSLSLRGRLAFLARDSALYGGAAMVSKAFGLITFPLLTRHFSVAEYGLINYFYVVATFLAVLFVFGQDSAVARYFYEHEDDASRREVISQSLFMQIAWLGVFLPLLWLVSSRIAAHLHPSPQAGEILGLVLLQVPFAVAINFSVNLLKWTFSRWKFLVMSLGSLASNLALLVAALWLLDVGPAGIFKILLANNAFFACLGMLFIRRWLVLPRDMRFASSLLKFAIPFGVIGVLAMLVPLLERAAVERLLGERELGIYAAAAAVAALVSLLTGAFQTAWGPFSLSLYKSADSGITYNWVFKGFAIVACVGVLLLSAAAGPLLALLAPPRYADAAMLVFPLAMGLAVQAIGWITEIGISISKKAHLSLWGYGAFVVVTLGAVLGLGSLFGMYGVAAGALVGYFAKSVSQSALSQYAHRLPWSYGPALGLIALTVGIGLCAHWTAEVIPGPPALVFLCGAALILVAGYFGSFTAEERTRIRLIVPRLGAPRLTGGGD